MEGIDEEIEYNFTPSAFVKDFPQKIACSTYMKQFQKATKLARDLFDNTLDILYGDKSECRLDLYRCKDTQDTAPVFIFVHGGYWQECSKDDYGAVAFPVMEANAIAAVVGYQLAPHGMLLLSGIYELSPLIKTSMTLALKMDKDVATRNSPSLLLKEQKPAFVCPVVVAYAELDPPSFKHQSQTFCKVLENQGIATKCLEIPDTDHFSLISKLTNSKYQLSQEIIAMIMQK